MFNILSHVLIGLIQKTETLDFDYSSATLLSWWDTKQAEWIKDVVISTTLAVKAERTSHDSTREL